MKIEPLHPKFVAQIDHIDLRHPSQSDVTMFRKALLDHKVVIVRGQILTQQQYVDFCARLGDIWTTDDEMQAERNFQVGPHRELVAVSNRGVLGPMALEWHADGSHHPSRPYPIRALYGASIPQDSSGRTTWADMQEGYCCLPDWLHAAAHTYWARHKPRYAVGWEDIEVIRPLIRLHPLTGSVSLSVDRYFTVQLYNHVVEAGDVIWNDPLAKEESDHLIDQLINAATDCDNTYSHDWRPYDLVMFDNNNTVHKREAIKGDDERLLWRITMDWI